MVHTPAQRFAIVARERRGFSSRLRGFTLDDSASEISLKEAFRRATAREVSRLFSRKGRRTPERGPRLTNGSPSRTVLPLTVIFLCYLF
ncbi:MAG: hypothetical protein QG668_73 [Patescibacteria group bacterium]|nr:hypothetical protein [Patescibacteria group bacterium]